MKKCSCEGTLNYGQTCSQCGASRSTLKESHASLLICAPKGMEHIAGLFSAVSERNCKELTAILDIEFRLTHAIHDDPLKLRSLISRMWAGELPSDLVKET